MKLMAADVPAVAVRRRSVRRDLRKDGSASAAELIGPLRAGDEISGITNGQFSLIDMLHHFLDQAGPADVVVATWTMGIYDAERAYRFVNDKRIRRMRFIVDPSIFTRKPELASILVKGFGPDAFRAVNCHAKFCTVRSDRLAICVRSSMNLNANNRLESFDISCDDAMTAFYETLAGEIWRRIGENSRTQSQSVFEDLLEVSSVANPRRANPFLAAT